MTLSTDEMDSITPDERAALVGQCEYCGEWTKYDSRVDKAVCKTDGRPLLLQSIHSQRTFNPNRKVARKRLRKAAS